MRLSLADVLRDHGAGLVQMAQFGPLAPGTQVSADPVRQTDQCLVFALAAGGRKVAVKVFNPRYPGTAAACAREIECARALVPTGLAPRILGAAPDHLIVVTEWQEGTALDTVVTRATAPAWARRVGAWYRGFAGAVGQLPAQGTWADYLARYTAHGVARAFRQHTAALRALPVPAQSIARNDGHLSNFLVAPGDRLFGIDFEAASLKPLGWDVLLTARTLAMMFPADTAEVLAALVAGWHGDEEDAALPLTFVALFARVTAPLKLG